MKFELYRKVDLIIFGILMVFSSVLSLFLFSNKSYQFYICFTNLLIYITMIRWKYFALIPIAINQIIIAVVQIEFFEIDYALSIVVNLFNLFLIWIIPVLLDKKIRKIKNKPIILFLMFILTNILIGIGRTIGLLVLGDTNILGNLIFYLINQELFSMLISLVLLGFLKNIDNLLVDVKEYLLELNEEDKFEKIGGSDGGV